jgi:folate-binding protein YgfZ
MTGYEALRSGAAWLDLSARGKIKLTGEDRARLLHAMTTNHIEQLTPGAGCYAFFLNDKGRILSDANILCRPDHFLLDVEPEARKALYQHLDHYIIADDVTLEDITEHTATIAIEGPKSNEVLEALGAPLPQADYASLDWDTRVVARLSATGGPGFFVFAPVAEKADLIGKMEAAGALAADPEALRIVRLEHGKPRYGEDISERFLAQEANQPHALHFSKGCYLGQEIVERVRSRGQIHRVLMPLVLDTDQPPSPGAKLQTGETSAAEITSAAYSPALKKVVALGYVKTEYARPHEPLTLGPIHAEVAAPAGR